MKKISERAKIEEIRQHTRRIEIKRDLLAEVMRINQERINALTDCVHNGEAVTICRHRMNLLNTYENGLITLKQLNEAS